MTAQEASIGFSLRPLAMDLGAGNQFPTVKASNQPFAQKPGPKAVQVLSVQARGKFELVTNKGNCRMLRKQTRRTKTVFETEK